MSSHLSTRILIAVLRGLPVHMLSRAAGRLAAWSLPRGLRRGALTAFGRVFGVDFEEVRDPLESFDSVQAFFVRRLREGCRSPDPRADSLVSPCDGAWGVSGRVSDGTLLQIKGRPYSLAALLGSEAAVEQFEGGPYATLYLSPKDYHRLHAPCAARVTAATYLPGSLWPVNRIGVEGIDGLFAENERICVYLEAPEQAGGGRLCAVAVGATLVGKVKLRFDDLETNLPGASVVERTYAPEMPHFEKGEEWGHFEFGSTVVLVGTPGTTTLDSPPQGTSVRMGERIGSLNSAVS